MNWQHPEAESPGASSDAPSRRGQLWGRCLFYCRLKDGSLGASDWDQGRKATPLSSDAV